MVKKRKSVKSKKVAAERPAVLGKPRPRKKVVAKQSAVLSKPRPRKKVIAERPAVLSTLQPGRIATIIGLLALCAILGYYDWTVHRPRDFGDQIWVIKRGDTLRQIASQLKRDSIIGETVSLRLMARVHGLGRQIRPGEYRFSRATTLTQFLQRIVSDTGQIGIKVTILEGWTFQQMREQLRQAPRLKQASATMTEQQIMSELGYPELSAEGRFFPDTYYYTAQHTDLSVYRQAFQLMQEKLAAAWENRADDLILKNKDEALIMASIIEKESQIVAEQPKIAGVFHNRLKKRMRLQADPTVVYGLGQKYKGNITRAHLRIDTPYNTYTRNGLTPTPICLPSEQALNAAVRPDTTAAYYFVAKGNGQHHFSRTLAQHNKAVKRYLRKRK